MLMVTLVTLLYRFLDYDTWLDVVQDKPMIFLESKLGWPNQDL